MDIETKYDESGIPYTFRLISGKISKLDIKESLGCTDKVFVTEMRLFQNSDTKFSSDYNPFLRKRGVPVRMAKRIIEKFTGETAHISIIITTSV